MLVFFLQKENRGISDPLECRPNPTPNSVEIGNICYSVLKTT